MTKDARWIADQIAQVMGLARGAKSDPSYVELAEAALLKLSEDAERYEFPNKPVVLGAIQEAVTVFAAGHATRAVQHLSHALMTLSRSEPR
jgi:hypothetical protein